MKIKTLKRTCDACPSQWEGKLYDGRMFYVRYRWGYLSLRVSFEETDDVMDAVRGEEVFGKMLDSNEWDGSLSTDDMLFITQMRIPQERIDK